MTVVDTCDSDQRLALNPAQTTGERLLATAPSAELGAGMRNFLAAGGAADGAPTGHEPPVSRPDSCRS